MHLDARGAEHTQRRAKGFELASAPFLLGSTFSVADLNVASVAAAVFTTRFDLTPFPNVQACLTRCLERPAAQRTVAMNLKVGRG